MDKFTNLINTIIGGDINYNKESRNLVFSANKVDINFSNTAVGVKSFAILNILLQSIELNGRHLLIIDEPEVHLHPKWQIKYAELLVLMSKELDIKLLINSHSPYFIEALKTYSVKHNYKEETNFYLASKNEDQTVSIKNVNNKLDDIFALLSEPFDELNKIYLEDFLEDDNE